MAATTVTVNILNARGDETRNVLLSDIDSFLAEEASKGLWIFDDASNEMINDVKGLSSRFESGGSVTVMPASVGG